MWAPAGTGRFRIKMVKIVDREAWHHFRQPRKRVGAITRGVIRPDYLRCIPDDSDCRAWAKCDETATQTAHYAQVTSSYPLFESMPRQPGKHPKMDSM